MVYERQVRAAARRRAIYEMSQKCLLPQKAELARQLGVSKQVIAHDIAFLRSEGKDVQFKSRRGSRPQNPSILPCIRERIRGRYNRGATLDELSEAFAIPVTELQHLTASWVEPSQAASKGQRYTYRVKTPGLDRRVTADSLDRARQLAHLGLQSVEITSQGILA